MNTQEAINMLRVQSQVTLLDDGTLVIAPTAQGKAVPPMVEELFETRKDITMSTGTAPGAGGNLAHNPTNDTRFHELLTTTRTLGATKGQGEDVQIRHLLSVTQAAFEGVIDNTENKHGLGVDDATMITEEYWKARNSNVTFNPKADNQRKTISCIRQCITLGGWSKGGPGEPIGMVNRAMTLYRNMRKTPDMAKRLMDAANYLIVVARRMKKSDQLLDDDELQALAFKKDPEVLTVEDVLDSTRAKLKKLYEGKHPAGTCASPNVEKAIKALNAELKGIADGKRNAVATQAGADIATEANAQARDEAKTGGAAPVSV